MSPADLARLIDGHSAPLVLYARQWCDAPEDVVQEAFVKLVRQRRPPEDVVAWLYRVVRHGALNAAKSARRRQRRESAAARPVRWFVEPEIQAGAHRIMDEMFQVLR
jgi:RNA polymerase sigma-70 factor (ECF subfamily)